MPRSACYHLAATHISRPILIIAGVWLLSIGLIGVAGDFPLFDDWVYSTTARALAERGVLEFGPSAEILMLPQLLWGALFALPEFSHAALRASTLAAAAVASIAVFGMLRLAGTSDRRALAGAIALATTPVFHVLSYSFMSDVPTVTLIALSLYAFVRCLRFGNDGWFWISFAIALLACLNRVTSVTLVGGLLVGRVLARPSVATLARVVVLAVGVVLFLNAAERLLASTVGLPGLYYWRSERSVETVQALTTAAGMVQIAWAFTRAWLHLGLMMLPLVLVCGIRLAPAGLATLAALGVVVAGFDKRLPLIGNLFYEAGVGPVMVHGLERLTLGDTFWRVATVAAVVGSAFLADLAVRVLLRAWSERRSLVPWTRDELHKSRSAAPGWQGARSEHSGAIRATSNAASQDAPPANCVTHHASRGLAVPLILQVTGLSIVVALLAGHSLYNVFDRYLLMALPAAMLLVALEPAAVSAPFRAWSERLGWVLVAAVAVFAMLATADSLAWQRARWRVLRQATATGITADAIDGGQEFNGVTRGNSFAAVTGASYELRFVDSQTPGALCAGVDVWIGPRAGGICLLPVNRTPGTHN